MVQKPSPKEELETTICQIIPLMRQAVDLSLALRKEGENSYVTESWEEFLGEFLRYIKVRGTEQGENLLKDISMGKVLSPR